MLFCLKDGDAFPTEALGLPSRLIPEPIPATAEQSARWDFERLCHAYPDGSFPYGDGQEPCPVQSATTLSSEPPVPGPADEQYWQPVLRFHRDRIGMTAFAEAARAFRLSRPGALVWSDYYQLLQSLCSIPSL